MNCPGKAEATGRVVSETGVFIAGCIFVERPKNMCQLDEKFTRELKREST